MPPGAAVSRTGIPLPPPQRALLLLIASALVRFLLLDGSQYLTLEAIQGHRLQLARQVADQPLPSAALLVLLYVAMTALSLPGATLLTLLAGALFGRVWGTRLVSLASTLGATLAFGASRILFREAVQRRFGRQLATFNRGIEREGAFYLFTLRLAPVVPFVVINLAMGLTALRWQTFAWVSQIGMLAGTLVYVNAGTRLGQLHALQGILSPGLLLSLALLGLFPLAVRRLGRLCGQVGGRPRPRGRL